MTQDTSVRLAESRKTVQIHLADGRIFEAPMGTPLKTFIGAAYDAPPFPIVAALVDGALEELSMPVTRDVSVQPLDLTTHDGIRIYQRSLSFLLIVAVYELFPEATVIVDHSIALGGFFCQVRGRPLFTSQELRAIEARMRDIVAADEPILKKRMAVSDATAVFAAQGYEDKVRLLAYREEPDISIYVLRGVHDYFYGYMMASTGQMHLFSLGLESDGIILRLPQRHQPDILPATRSYPKLSAVFREYGQWLSILDMDDISSLNEAVLHGGIRQAILVAEALQEKNISDIADAIAHRGKRKGLSRPRIILVAGPSSSGKTTFARRLSIQLIVNGIRPFTIGTDDYFLDRASTPRDAEGNYDFEALEAINLPVFNQQLLALLNGETVRPPVYDFRTGLSTPGKEMRLPDGAVLIVEGIHGLNPLLISSVPDEQVYRIYISALTQLNIDHHNRVPTTDTRLVRRVVRDAQFRGYPAKDTIERWDSVRRGEEHNIFPYQENADIMFNSALAYELAVLKPLAEPLLLRVPRQSLAWVEARRLLAFLQWVRPCPPDMVPSNSILREFIGGSALADLAL
jgi:uridine kinase